MDENIVYNVTYDPLQSGDPIEISEPQDGDTEELTVIEEIDALVSGVNTGYENGLITSRGVKNQLVAKNLG